MTREEAIKELRDASDDEVRYGDTERHYKEVMKRIEAFDMAIKALEQQPCDDCISRKDVIDIINFEDKWLFDAKSYNANTEIAFSGFKSKVKAIPPVTPQRLKGKWIEVFVETPNDPYSYGFKSHKCSKCEYSPLQISNYCPNCGRRMQSED